MNQRIETRHEKERVKIINTDKFQKNRSTHAQLKTFYNPKNKRQMYGSDALME